MSYVTVEVDIDHGRIVPREPAKLPEKATGLLTILSTTSEVNAKGQSRERIKMPLIKGDGKRIIQPTPEELDASTWGD